MKTKALVATLSLPGGITPAFGTNKTSNGMAVLDRLVIEGPSVATSKTGVFVMSKVGDDFGFFNFTGTVPANKAYYE